VAANCFRSRYTPKIISHGHKLYIQYFVEAGAIAVRRVLPADLRRIAKATGGQIVVTMADLDGELAFDPATLGECYI
jgi:chaperonin GroEL (HSP60 family)